VKGSIVKRGKGFRLIVEAGADPVTGRRRQVTRTVRGTRAHAELELARLLVEIGRGDAIGHDATVSQLLDAWMKIARLGVTTRRDYASAIKCHITTAIGAKKVWQLRARDLDRLYADLAAKKVGPARIRRVHNILSRALGQGVRWEWVVRNVARDASPPSEPRPDPKPPETAEVLRLLEAADGELLAWLRLGAVLGSRRGEVCGIRWGDVDLDAATVQVRRAIADGGPGVGLVAKNVKNERHRPAVALDPATVTALRSHRRFCAERLLAIGAALTAETYVFHSDADGMRPWRPDAVSHRFDRLRDGLGLEHVKLKALRHYVATQLLAAGVDPRTVAGRLGHARTSTTLDIYAAFVPAKDQDAADLMGRLLG
jgi:integrase